MPITQSLYFGSAWRLFSLRARIEVGLPKVCTAPAAAGGGAAAAAANEPCLAPPRKRGGGGRLSWHAHDREELLGRGIDRVFSRRGLCVRCFFGCCRYVSRTNVGLTRVFFFSHLMFARPKRVGDAPCTEKPRRKRQGRASGRVLTGGERGKDFGLIAVAPLKKNLSGKEAEHRHTSTF